MVMLSMSLAAAAALQLLAVGAAELAHGKGFRARDMTRPAQTYRIAQALVDAAPDAIDWSTNATSPIKNQGICNSCWAFSAIETVESAAFLKTGKMLVLSTEELITCDNVQDGGCMSGNTFSGVEYLEKHGVATAADYPSGRSTNTTAACTWDRQVRLNRVPTATLRLELATAATPPRGYRCTPFPM